ncbi:hypothetical protein BJV82DRAFT_675355 [Fennellomyces sp. T-0311]|nr:hypothetical protein BJV82DRAFT_675355 [Fennellomyces sp. T-0311]
MPQKSKSLPKKASKGSSNLQAQFSELQDQVKALTQNLETVYGVAQYMENAIKSLVKQEQEHYSQVTDALESLTSVVQNHREPDDPAVGISTKKLEFIPAPRKEKIVKGKRRLFKLAIRKPLIVKYVIKRNSPDMDEIEAQGRYSTIRSERHTILKALVQHLKRLQKEQRADKKRTENTDEEQINGDDEKQIDSDDEEKVDSESKGQLDSDDEGQVESGDESSDDSSDESSDEDEAEDDYDPRLLTWKSIPRPVRLMTIKAYESSAYEESKIDMSKCEKHWAAKHMLSEGWSNLRKKAIAKKGEAEKHVNKRASPDGSSDDPEQPPKRLRNESEHDDNTCENYLADEDEDDDQLLLVDYGDDENLDDDEETEVVDDNDGEVIVIDDDDEEPAVAVEDDLFTRMGNAEESLLQSYQQYQRALQELQGSLRQLQQDQEAYRNMLPPNQRQVFNNAFQSNNTDRYLRVIHQHRNVRRRQNTTRNGYHLYTRYYPA